MEGRRRTKYLTVRGTKRQAEVAAANWISINSPLREEDSSAFSILLKEFERRLKHLEERTGGGGSRSARVFTDLEWEALLLLGRLGLRPRRRTIAGKAVDFVLDPEMLVIEVDGLFHDLPEQQERDRDSDFRLKAAGYRVIHLRHDERHLWEVKMVEAINDEGCNPVGQATEAPADELTVEQAAVYCNLPVGSVRRLIAQDRLSVPLSMLSIQQWIVRESAFQRKREP